jgi:hypothetical protein
MATCVFGPRVRGFRVVLHCQEARRLIGDSMRVRSKGVLVKDNNKKNPGKTRIRYRILDKRAC